MVTNPCCCDLQLGVKIVAIVNMVSDILWLTLSIISLVSLALIFSDDSYGEVSGYEIAFILIGVLTVLAALAHFALSYVLYSGAKTRDISRCSIWLIVTLVSLIFNTLGNLHSPYSIAGIFLAAMVTLYQCWVVYAFMEEVKAEQIQRSNQIQVVNFDYSGPMGYPPYGPAPPYQPEPVKLPQKF